MTDESLPAEVDDNLKVLELRAQWSVPGISSGESRWRFVMLRTGLFDQMQALADRWLEQIEEPWEEFREDTWTFERVVVRDLWPATAPDLIVPVGFVFTGALEDQGPPQASPIVTWRSDFIGRSYRGRTYWGPVRYPDLNAGTYVGGVQGAVNSFANAMMDTFAGGGLDAIDPHFIIFSRQHNGVPEPKGRYAPVTSFTQQPYLGTQRRRQRQIRP
jgi:hypothetical protein